MDILAIQKAIQKEWREIYETTIQAKKKTANDALTKLAKLHPNDDGEDDNAKITRFVKILGSSAAAEDPKILELVRNSSIKQTSEALKTFAVLGVRPAVEDAAIREYIGKEKNFLLDHWINAPEVPLEFSLCYYSDAGIARLLYWCNGGPELGITSIRKLYETLGLKRSKHVVIQEIKTDDVKGLAIPVPFRKYRLHDRPRKGV